MAIYGWSWLLENNLAAMAMPDGGRGDFRELRNRGITGLVTLTTRPLNAHKARDEGLAYLHLPVGNFEPPSQEQIRQFVDFCDQHIADGGAVAVHCLAGMGRTGTMLACYLVSAGNDPEEAINIIRRRRPGSIETVEQEEAVRHYAEELHGAT